MHESWTVTRKEDTWKHAKVVLPLRRTDQEIDHVPQYAFDGKSTKDARNTSAAGIL